MKLLGRTAGLPRPDRPLTVYRGTCGDEHDSECWGMSRSTNRDAAEMYCHYHRYFHGGDCHSAPTILSTVVQPEAVLADLGPFGKADSEIIVNPRRLGHVTVSGSKAVAA